MLKKYITKSKETIKNNIFLFFILFVIFIIFLLFYYKKYEYYDPSSQPISGTFTLGENSFNNNVTHRNILDEEGDNQFYYQKGIGSPSHIGTINFTKPFPETPLVFTQINGTPDSEDNLYSISVSNITPNSFNYYKNVITNNIIPSEEGDMVAMQLSHDDNRSFNWVAFQ